MIHNFKTHKFFNIFNKIEEDFESHWGEIEKGKKMDPDLKDLLNQADDLVFKKYNIEISEQKYFIAGSARLFMFPEIRKELGLDLKIGDLDIVIPDKSLWIKAGLQKELNNRGIYKATDKIEVFDVWDPSRAGGRFENVRSRNTFDILKEAKNVHGFFFMPFRDIFHYKMQMDREKEKEIVEIFTKWEKSVGAERFGLKRRLLSACGGAKELKKLFI